MKNITIYTMPKKREPIRILKIRCRVDGTSITLNLPIMRRAYVSLIELVNVFPMARYKIVMLRASCVYQEIQLTCGIFYGILIAIRKRCI